MAFAEPGRLAWLVLPAALAVAGLWQHARRRRRLSEFGEIGLVTRLIDPAAERRGAGSLMTAAAVALAVLAAARPQFGTRLSEVTRRGSDVFVAIDVSQSMLAEDVAPSRMVKAKRALNLLIQQLQGDRVGVIAFAGRAYLQCPLTLDVQAAGLFLDSLDVGTVPDPGTSLGEPVRLALRHFSRTSRTEKVVVLLTDGEDTRDSAPLAAAREAAEAGVTLYTLGLGTPRGEVIKIRDDAGAVTSFKKDERGETVLSRLDEGLLVEMAKVSGGRYARSSPDDAEILSLAEEVSSHARAALSSDTYRVREDRFQWFLFPAVLLLIGELLLPYRTGFYSGLAGRLRGLPRPRFPARFLRRRRAAAALIAALLVPHVAAASYRGHLNQGNRHFRLADYELARQEYFNAQAERPESAEPAYNIGNAYAADGDVEEALRFYGQAATLARRPRMKALIAYNRGCVLAAAGRFDDAAEAFKNALRLDPEDGDAKHNLEWARAPKQPRDREPDGNRDGKGDGDRPRSDRLSKEDAERVLRMIRDKERRARERMNDANEDDGERAEGVRDW